MNPVIWFFILASVTINVVTPFYLDLITASNLVKIYFASVTIIVLIVLFRLRTPPDFGQIASCWCDHYCHIYSISVATPQQLVEISVASVNIIVPIFLFTLQLPSILGKFIVASVTIIYR